MDITVLKTIRILDPWLANHSPSSDHICQCYKLKSNYYICSVKGSLKVVKLISSQNDKVNKHRNFRPFSINFYFLIFPARIQDRNELHESQLRIFNNCLATNVQNDQTVFDKWTKIIELRSSLIQSQGQDSLAERSKDREPTLQDSELNSIGPKPQKVLYNKFCRA